MMSPAAHRTRGAILIFALMLCTLLLVIGMGFVAQRSLEYGSVSQLQDKAQARQLAMAGMEDARIKLEKDPFFPQVGGFGQSTFTYSEQLLDPSDASVVGVYKVTVDVSLKEEPFRIIRIVAVGDAGPDSADPLATYSIYAELDVASLDRDNPGTPNPKLYRYIDWREQDVWKGGFFKMPH
jgi:hypothetical protein